MKKTLVLAFFAAIAIAGTASAQTPAAANAPVPAAAPAPANVDPSKVLKFEKTTYDYGEIPKGTPATATFDFKNISKKPVVLQNVQGSCGCTVPAWDKAPTAPGKSNKVSATYNAANAGKFTKTVTVTTDVGAVYTLTITGTVKE